VGFVPEEDASFRQMIAEYENASGNSDQIVFLEEFTQKANDATIRTALHHGI
jgi:hypothetical protein